MAGCCLHLLLLLPLQPLRKAASTLKKPKKTSNNHNKTKEISQHKPVKYRHEKREEERKHDAWKRRLLRQNFPLPQHESRKIKGGYSTYIPVELAAILNLWTKQAVGCPSVSVPYGMYWYTSEQCWIAFPYLKPYFTSCFGIIAQCQHLSVTSLMW